jgi:hypothetical protein
MKKTLCGSLVVPSRPRVTWLKQKGLFYRLISILLIASMMLSLVSCGKPSAPPPTSKYAPGTVLTEDILVENIIGEKYLTEEYWYEDDIFEDALVEALLEEDEITEVYSVEYIIIEKDATDFFTEDELRTVYGSGFDYNQVLEKFAVGGAVILITAIVAVAGSGAPDDYASYLALPLKQAVCGSLLGALLGAGQGAVSAIDPRLGLAWAVADMVLSLVKLVKMAPVIAVSTATPVTFTVGIGLVVNRIGSAVMSAKRLVAAIDTYKSTDISEIDWTNIDWEKVGYAALDSGAAGFEFGAVTGAISGSVQAAIGISSLVKFRNTSPQGLTTLTDDQINSLKDNGFTDKQIANLEYDTNTDRPFMNDPNAGKIGTNVDTPKGKVRYIRKTVNIKGIDIDVVEADFSKYTVYEHELLPSQFSSGSYRQYANAGLKKAIDESSAVMRQFTREQLADINNGKNPTGFVWNHSMKEGLLQLVPDEVHGEVSHTGGNALWGANQG